jgi:uncharacterized protein (TIGR02391 family)
MLITNTQANELLSTLHQLSGLDEQLAHRCGPPIRSERYDEAVGSAFVVLEERLRSLLGVPGGSGVDLAQKAFKPENGELVARLNRPIAEVQGIRDLFVGGFKAYRNRAAHTFAGYSLDEARAIIQLVNLLLLILVQVERAPQHPILQEISKLLGGAVSQRLNGFLKELESMGFRQGEGKTAIPFRVPLMYKAPSRQEPHLHLTTVFYILVVDGAPVLSFRTGPRGLKQVVGLNVVRLVSELLQAGCVRIDAKSTPIRLFLKEKNSKATFERLFQILTGLAREHGS